MDLDLNRYDVEHVCTAHSKMSTKEWQDIYFQSTWWSSEPGQRRQTEEFEKVDGQFILDSRYRV